ncbi:uncharacterized protein V6R79_003194 [Siganus canaliculatus]
MEAEPSRCTLLAIYCILLKTDKTLHCVKSSRPLQDASLSTYCCQRWRHKERDGEERRMEEELQRHVEKSTDR